jgi:hypothetical protein
VDKTGVSGMQSVNNHQCCKQHCVVLADLIDLTSLEKSNSLINEENSSGAISHRTVYYLYYLHCAHRPCGAGFYLHVTVAADSQLTDVQG